jgi:hypothetical protein
MEEWKKLKNKIESAVIDSMTLNRIKKHLENVVATEKRDRERARANVGLGMMARYRKEMEDEYYGRTS